MKIKVLVIDDSALIRSLLTEIINSQPDMEVVGVAPDPLIARELIKQKNPDVLTLDVEMPKMDGLDFLERLMRLRPMPVVMISTLTERGSEITLRALELGAVDFITKPKMSITEGILDYTDKIADLIRAASRARIAAPRRVAENTEKAAAPVSIRNPLISSEKLIIIGASTGGTEAIKSFCWRCLRIVRASLSPSICLPALPSLSPTGWIRCAAYLLKRPRVANAYFPATPISRRAINICCWPVAAPIMSRN